MLVTPRRNTGSTCHPENAPPPVLPTSRSLFRPGTFSPAHNLHRDFPVRQMRDTGKMRASDLFPRPGLLHTDRQACTGHTYGFSQLSDPVLQIRLFSLWQFFFSRKKGIQRFQVPFLRCIRICLHSKAVRPHPAQIIHV